MRQILNHICEPSRHGSAWPVDRPPGTARPSRPYPTGTPWPNRNPSTSSTSRCSGSCLPSPGRGRGSGTNIGGGQLLRSLTQVFEAGGDAATYLLYPGRLGMGMTDGDARLASMTRHPGRGMGRGGRLVMASVCWCGLARRTKRLHQLYTRALRRAMKRQRLSRPPSRGLCASTARRFFYPRGHAQFEEIGQPFLFGQCHRTGRWCAHYSDGRREWLTVMRVLPHTPEDERH